MLVGSCSKCRLVKLCQLGASNCRVRIVNSSSARHILNRPRIIAADNANVYALALQKRYRIDDTIAQQITQQNYRQRPAAAWL